MNPAREGSKAAMHHELTVPAGGSRTVRLRLAPAGAQRSPAQSFDTVFHDRITEADAFYRQLTPKGASEDEARVLRQALAGMLWSKQYYAFDLETWLAEHDLTPWSLPRPGIRNREWFHMVSDEIVSMPDKWEYPGSPPGIWPSTRSRSPSSTPRSPRNSSNCCCVTTTCTRTARSPPTSGTSAT